jgi:hypothetical protein
MAATADTLKFVEYDQRAHRLETLASFTFWVQSSYPALFPNMPADQSRHGAPAAEPKVSLTTPGTRRPSPAARAVSTVDRVTSERLGGRRP